MFPNWMAKSVNHLKKHYNLEQRTPHLSHGSLQWYKTHNIYQHDTVTLPKGQRIWSFTSSKASSGTLVTTFNTLSTINDVLITFQVKTGSLNLAIHFSVFQNFKLKLSCFTITGLNWEIPRLKPPLLPRPPLLPPLNPVRNIQYWNTKIHVQ